MADWITACALDDLLEEDILLFQHDGATYALCLDDGDTPHCTASTCPRDGANLAGGLIDDEVIECPMGECRFHLATGLPEDGAADTALAVYPARLNGRMVEVCFA